MKKFFNIILAAAAAFALSSCVQPDMSCEFVHENPQISAINIAPGTSSSSLQISGVIDQEAGTITFTVPKASRRQIDLSAVKIRATVGFDAFVTPSLYGVHDLSSSMEITVTTKQPGSAQVEKKYVLSASYAK